MTGFDETVPPDLDPDTDATSADDVGDNVIAPSGGPVPGHAGDTGHDDGHHDDGHHDGGHHDGESASTPHPAG